MVAEFRNFKVHLRHGFNLFFQMYHFFNVRYTILYQIFPKICTVVLSKNYQERYLIRQLWSKMWNIFEVTFSEFDN